MIYLDYAAATPVDKSVLMAMKPYFQEKYANPSSIYYFGQQGRKVIDSARERVADVLKCTPEEIFFTGSGTESNNWAVFGTANALDGEVSKKHIITTKIEHHSVLHPVEELQRRGYKTTMLQVNSYGEVGLEDLKKAITPETFFVSIIFGQNEIGTIQDIAAIGKFLRSKGILFHTDACQAAGAVPLNVEELYVDLMTLNSGKIYGPKGIGALYIRKGVKITPLIYGGGQEHRLRAGTENVAGIVGFAVALKKAEALREKESKRLSGLRDRFIQQLIKKIPGTKLNGHPQKRLPNNINISFPGIDAESLLVKLDMEGVCASTGSACTSGIVTLSHVLTGIGLSPQEARNTVRFTIGRRTTRKDIDQTVKILLKIMKNTVR